MGDAEMKTLNQDDYVVTRHNAVFHGDDAYKFSCRVLDIDESSARCEKVEEEHMLSCDDECINTCKLCDARDEVVEAAQTWLNDSTKVRRIAGETNRQGRSGDYYYACRGYTGRVQIRPDAAPHWYQDGTEFELDDDQKSEVLDALDSL